MSLKAKVEAIIYAAEEPITLDQIASLLRSDVLSDLAAAKAAAEAAAAEAAANGEAAPEVSANGEISPELAADEEPAPEAGPLMQFNGEAKDETVDEKPAEDESASEAPTVESAEVKPEEVAANADAPAQSAEAAANELSVNEPSANEATPAESAAVAAPESTSRKRAPKKTEAEIAEDKAVRTRLREVLAELIADCAGEERGIEVRQVAGGFRMATKPEHHDVVRAFAKSLKPPIRLSLAALETLAVIAYKQPITAPEITDIRGVESGGVIGTLLDRKLITTAGRKQVIGRPMQYKTSKEFLLRFGLNDVNELPSMEEFSQLASDVAALDAAPAEPTLFENEPTEGDAEESSIEHGEAAASTEPAPKPVPDDGTGEAVSEPALADAPDVAPQEAAAPAAEAASEPDQPETESAPEEEPAGRE